VPPPLASQLAANAKRLVDALELMGVLAKGADRLSVEKLARYFIRTFKDIQQGKAAGNIKTTLGADLQALTEQQVFRFPSTFTFIFRAFASYDGIGKGLDEGYDLTKFAQPFINELTETEGYSSPINKWADRLGKATGLNSGDVETALMQVLLPPPPSSHSSPHTSYPPFRCFSLPLGAHTSLPPPCCCRSRARCSTSRRRSARWSRAPSRSACARSRTSRRSRGSSSRRTSATSCSSRRCCSTSR